MCWRLIATIPMLAGKLVQFFEKRTALGKLAQGIVFLTAFSHHTVHIYLKKSESQGDHHNIFFLEIQLGNVSDPDCLGYFSK